MVFITYYLTTTTTTIKLLFNCTNSRNVETMTKIGTWLILIVALRISPFIITANVTSSSNTNSKEFTLYTFIVKQI